MSASTPSAELTPYPSIDWYAQHHCNTDDKAEAYRHLALGIEQTLIQDGRGVSLEKKLAVIVINALMDLSDRIDIDS